MRSLFSLPSGLSLTPPKQQFFNCAIVEIIFPVLRVCALVKCCTDPLPTCKWVLLLPARETRPSRPYSSDSLSRKTEIALCVVKDLTKLDLKSLLDTLCFVENLALARYTCTGQPTTGPKNLIVANPVRAL